MNIESCFYTTTGGHIRSWNTHLAEEYWMYCVGKFVYRHYLICGMKAVYEHFDV